MISPFFVFVNNENKLFSAKMKWGSRCESSLAYLSFKKGKKRRFGTQFQHVYDKIKNAALPRFLRKRYELGLSAPNPDQRTFREKSFGISKAFAKIKWYVRQEILWLTFLIRKVS